jgi:hypothetical protein
LVRRIPHTVPYGLRAVSGSSGRPLQCAREHTTPPTDLEPSTKFCPTLKVWPRPDSSHEVRSPSSATTQGKLLAPGLPLPATSAHRVSHPLDGLTPPLVCPALFHAEYAHGIPSYSPSAPKTCRNKLPKEWGVPCGTPRLGFGHGCLGRSLLRGSLSRASSVCTPFRPPPSPGFPVNTISTSLKQRKSMRRYAARACRATIESTKPPLELPPREVQHQRWPGARRAKTNRHANRPFVSRSFSMPSDALQSRLYIPRGCPPEKLHLHLHTTSGQQGCPRFVGLSPASYRTTVTPRSYTGPPPSLREPWSCPRRTRRSSFSSASEHQSSGSPYDRSSGTQSSPLVLTLLSNRPRPPLPSAQGCPFTKLCSGQSMDGLQRHPQWRDQPEIEPTSPEGSASSFVRLKYAPNLRFFVGFPRGPLPHPLHPLELPPREVGSETRVHGLRQWAPANPSSSQHRRKNSALRLASSGGFQQASTPLWSCPLGCASSHLRPPGSARRIPVSIDRLLARQTILENCL